MLTQQTDWVIKELNRLEHFVVNHASLLLTMSNDDTARLNEYCGISPDKCIVIANGTDTAEFMPATSALKEKRKKEFELTGKQVVRCKTQRLSSWVGIEIVY